MKIRHHRFESFSQTSSPTSMDEPSSSIGHPSVSSHSDPQINIPKHPTFIKQMKQQRSIPPTESIIIAKPQKNVDQVVYTRRLVKIIPVSMEDMDENFDEDDWIKGCCGPDIKIVAKHGIPHGWVLIDGTLKYHLVLIFRSKTTTRENSEALESL